MQHFYISQKEELDRTCLEIARCKWEHESDDSSHSNQLRRLSLSCSTICQFPCIYIQVAFGYPVYYFGIPICKCTDDGGATVDCNYRGRNCVRDFYIRSSLITSYTRISKVVNSNSNWPRGHFQ